MKTPLYYTNPYEINALANVTEILELNGQYHVQLDAALFYPEGGGQPCDTGTIDSIPVLSVYENDAAVYHVLNVLPHTNRPVPCQVDWNRRFDHMQQHSGQHLLSAVMDHLYDAATVGFRLSEDIVTIDLEKRLTDDEIALAEQEANRLIWANKPILAYWPDSEKLAALPLRKQPQVDENIRIIEVDGYDYSPCCGTHVQLTGEIGLIKISRQENYKSGVRIEFRCGRRALAYYGLMIQITQALGRELSASPETLLQTFEKYRGEKEQLKEDLQSLKGQLVAYEAENLLASAQRVGSAKIVVKTGEADMKDLKNLAGALAQTPGTVVILGSTADGKAQLLLQRSQDLEALDLKAVFGEVAPLINARGGGNKFAAQGGGDKPEALDDCVQEAFGIIKAVLG